MPDSNDDADLWGLAFVIALGALFYFVMRAYTLGALGTLGMPQ